MGKKILKLIAVDELQYSRLREHGKTGMSFNDAIRAILDEVENRKIIQKHSNALEKAIVT